MTTDNKRPRNRGRMWMVVAAIAALFPLILWGSASPAAAQSGSTDSGTATGSTLVTSGPSEAAHHVYLPLTFSFVARPSSAFGVQLYNPSSASAALPLATQAHVSWNRMFISWSGVEPTNTTPGNYQFDLPDTQILAARQSGLNPIITIANNPSWAATYLNGPIDKVDIEEFAQFMGAVVERYDGDGRQDAPGSPVVDYWELYNEPDSGSIAGAEKGTGYWGYFGTEYAQMLCAIYPVMKEASPRAKVVLGGMAYDWFVPDGPFVKDFLDDVLAAGGGKCLDVVAFHYYPPFEANWSEFGKGVVGKTNAVRKVLSEHGVGNLPMIITEAGYHSNNNRSFPSTPELQADYVVKLFTQSLASRLGVMIWFTWSDYEIGGYQFLNGLLSESLQPKTAYYAYQTAAGKLGTAVFQRTLTSSELGSTSMQGYLFEHGGPLYVLWSDGTSTQSVGLPGRSARVIDPVGNIVAQIADGDDGQVDGRVRVTVGSRPIYVEIAL